jgi:2',3'-cyclic-nucleotide 2'-phosphodiesterase (5'-nucleotidase family)
MPRRAVLVLGTVMLALAACAAPQAEPAPSADEHPTVAHAPAAASEPIHLVILHTNDVHGQVLPRKAVWIDKDNPPLAGGLPRIAARIAEERAAEPDAFLVDAGDWFQGTPEGIVEGGVPFTAAFASAGFDAMCVGNHEFDRGLEHLGGLVRTARVPAILANVRTADGKRLAWAEPWLIVTRCGVRIAFVGLLTTSTPEITHPDARSLAFAQPAEELERVRREIGDRADLIVPVGHISVDESRRLAKAAPDLPLIVSGHSHTYLKEGVREGDTLIVQTGSKGSALGRVDLWFDPATHRVVKSEARVENLLDEPAAQWRSASIETACAALVEHASAELREVVGELEAPLVRHMETGSSAPGNWVADAMKKRMGADVALHNKGGTRSDLSAGPVTRRDLFELLPFDNNIVAMTLTGEQLLSLVRRTIENTEHKGCDYSGMLVVIERDANGAQHLTAVKVGGEPVDPARDYRVATNSFLADGGDGLIELRNGRDRREDPILMRDLMEEEFRDAPAHRAKPSDERRVMIAEHEGQR